MIVGSVCAFSSCCGVAVLTFLGMSRQLPVTTALHPASGETPNFCQSPLFFCAQRLDHFIDDIRSWLGMGGVSRFKDNLRRQMEIRRLPEERQNAIMACVEQLTQEKHLEICELVDQQIIPDKLGDFPSLNISADFDLDDFLERLNRGERPFEEWMYKHGYTRHDVAEIYKIVDSYLAPLGLHPSPFKG